MSPTTKPAAKTGARGPHAAAATASHHPLPRRVTDRDPEAVYDDHTEIDFDVNFDVDAVDEDEEDTDEEDEADDGEADGIAEFSSHVNTPLPPVVIEEYTAADYLTDELVPMPSGKGLRVAKLSFLSLVRSHQLPPNLLPVARQFAQLDRAAGTTASRKGHPGQSSGNGGGGKHAGGHAPTNEDALRLMDWVVCQCVRSFRVVDKVQEDCAPGEVSIARILDADKTAIFNYVLKGQRALADFR